jgi:RNA polymerase sigma factor (sigma-70 family)
MPDSVLEFRSLMDRVRTGCPQAAAELHARYSGHVRRIVRRHLGPRLRSQFDSVDFLQQVWQSFFAGELGVQQFDSPELLVAFLSRVAANKVSAEGRRNQTMKRDVDRINNRVRDPRELPSPHQPTPSQEVMAGERFELLVADQPPDVRRILEMLRVGYTHRAIARAVGISEKTIQRILQRLSQKHGQP